MIEDLKKKWEEDPLVVLGVGAAVVTAAAKLIDSLSARRGRNAYARQVNYRVKNRR